MVKNGGILCSFRIVPARVKIVIQQDNRLARGVSSSGPVYVTVVR